MGNFYCNISVKTRARAALIKCLAADKRAAFVSPLIDGMVVVYDRECDEQDLGAIDRLCQTLSAQLDTSVLAVLNHDDEYLLFEGYDDGKRVVSLRTADENKPNTVEIRSQFLDFAWNAFSGSGLSQKIKNLRKSLWRDSGKSAALGLFEQSWNFQVELHQQLVEALGLPYITVGFGYRHLKEGVEVPDLFSPDEFTELTGVAAPQQRKSKQAKVEVPEDRNWSSDIEVLNSYQGNWKLVASGNRMVTERLEHVLGCTLNIAANTITLSQSSIMGALVTTYRLLRWHSDGESVHLRCSASSPLFSTSKEGYYSIRLKSQLLVFQCYGSYSDSGAFSREQVPVLKFRRA